MRSHAGIVAVLACLVPQAAAGQVELVVEGGIGAFIGGDFSGYPPGPTFAAALHVSEWDNAQAGLEFVYAHHEGSGIEGATTQLGFLGLARYVLSSGPVGLYVGGKMGASFRSLTIVGDPARTDGFVLGPSAAIRLPMGPTKLQLTFDALYETFEELIMYGQREYGTDEDGLRFVLRAGVVVPLPSLRVGGESP
jgi:hypothetical protein